MFEKFGEFDSAEELNRVAAELKEKGDEDALVALAIENGLDQADAEDYMDDCTYFLATELQAALGKLKIEEKNLKLSGVLVDWVNELREMCTENLDFREAVRKKGKDLAGFIALTAEEGYKNRCDIDKRITEKTVQIKKIVGNHGFAIGIPDKRTRRQLAEQYYLGDAK